MPRKKPSNSVAAQVNAVYQASQPLPEVPAHVVMEDVDRLFLWDILRTRAREEWLPGDLVVAGQLARCQADIEFHSKALRTEGAIVENQRGTMVMNPRHSVVKELTQTQLALMRSLAMGGTAARGDKRGLGNARILQNKADGLKPDGDDELLA